MNSAKTYIRLKKPDARILPKPSSSTRFRVINESPAPILQNEDKSARTFLHVVGNRTTKNLTKSQGPVNLLSGFPCLKNGQGQTFSSTTIVNGSAISSGQIHPSCIDKRVVVLPVETIVPDDISAHVGIFMDAGVKKDDTCTTAENLTDDCYLTVQEECTLEQNPCPKKVAKPSLQKFLPGVGNAKRGLIRFGRSRMIADTHTSIPVAEFKAQLKDTMDITGKMDLAPSTKRMMYLLNTKGVNKLFAFPGRKMGSKTSTLFSRHLTLKQTPVDTIYDDMPLLPVGYVPEIDKSKIKRITRKRRYPEAEEYQRNLYKSQLEYLNSMGTDAGDTDQCKVSIFMDHDEIITDDKDGIVLLGSMDSMEIAIQEEEVLGDILYQDDLKEEVEVMGENQDDCEQTFMNEKSTIILVNDRDGSSECIEEALVEAENRGIRREDIQKVIIYQQGQLDDATNSSIFANNEKFIIMSSDCDPSETEIIVS